MDTFGTFLITFLIVVLIGAIICSVIDEVHDTEHEYWISDSKYEAIDEGIEKLVSGDIDSLIVTHPENPNVVGYVYFRSE